MNTFSVKDKVIMITGGTAGIGRGLVDYFLEQGAIVATTGRTPEKVERLRAELAGKRAVVYQLDVRDVASIQPVFEQVVADCGHLELRLPKKTGTP